MVFVKGKCLASWMELQSVDLKDDQLVAEMADMLDILMADMMET